MQGEQVEYLASNTEYLKKADPDIILRATHGMPDEVVKCLIKNLKQMIFGNTFLRLK